MGGGCVKVASKAKFLISYGNNWSSLIGLGKVSGFFTPIFWVLVPAKCLITPETARNSVGILGNKVSEFFTLMVNAVSPENTTH